MSSERRFFLHFKHLLNPTTEVMLGVEFHFVNIRLRMIHMRFLHIIVCNRRKSYAYLVHFCFQRFPSRVAAQESSRDSGTERQLVAEL
jgi:hypothetical protein